MGTGPAIGGESGRFWPIPTLHDEEWPRTIRGKWTYLGMGNGASLTDGWWTSVLRDRAPIGARSPMSLENLAHRDRLARLYG